MSRLIVSYGRDSIPNREVLVFVSATSSLKDERDYCIAALGCRQRISDRNAVLIKPFSLNQVPEKKKS
jgi:hypothetical protein